MIDAFLYQHFRFYRRLIWRRALVRDRKAFAGSYLVRAFVAMCLAALMIVVVAWALERAQ